MCNHSISFATDLTVFTTSSSQKKKLLTNKCFGHLVETYKGEIKSFVSDQTKLSSLRNYHHSKRVAAEIRTRDDNPIAVESALPAGRFFEFREESVPPATGDGADFGGGASHVPKGAFDCIYAKKHIYHWLNIMISISQS